MSVHALELNVKIIEQNIKYFKRPEGSLSKLNTYSDGLKILSRITIMLIDSRPIYLFSIISLILLVLSMLLLFPILNYWLDFGTVPVNFNIRNIFTNYRIYNFFDRVNFR